MLVAVVKVLAFAGLLIARRLFYYLTLGILGRNSRIGFIYFIVVLVKQTG